MVKADLIEQQHLNKDLKKVREKAMQKPRGKTFQTEGTANAKALRYHLRNKKNNNMASGRVVEMGLQRE